MPKYAYGFSEHPNMGDAVGEAVGQIQQTMDGNPPQLVLVFVSGEHSKDFSGVTKSIRTLLSPQKFVGVTTGTVIAGKRHVETGTGISIWATELEAEVFVLGQDMMAEVKNLPQTGTLILLADPRTFLAENYIMEIAQTTSEDPLKIMGGFLSTASNLIAIDKELFRGGAVGIYFPKDVLITNIVSQGCKPVGQPYTVTEAKDNTIISLGGQPPIKRLSQTFSSMNPDEREYLKSNLHIGIAVQENKLELEQGDFLIRAVTDLHKTGEIDVATNINVGDLVQFQILDPKGASENLRQLLQNQNTKSALMFTCNGRGYRLFEEFDHESNLVHSELTKDTTSDIPVVGMSCAGEFGPISNQNFVHGFTTSIALFN